MFLPIGDTPNPRNFTPVVTWGLIGLNVFLYVFVSLPLSMTGPSPSDPALAEYLRVMSENLPPPVSIRQFAAQISAYDLFVFRYGFRPGEPRLWDLFAGMFLHANFAHLAGNMLFLWIYGDNVEHRLGRGGFLVAYLGTGVVATVAYALLIGPSQVPLVGASGAISGVLGLYFLLFPRNQVKLFLFFFPFLMDIILVSARLVLGFYVVVDNLLPLLVASQSGVAYGAHLGGFAAGLGLAWVGERFGWRAPWRDRYWRVGMGRRPSPREPVVEAGPVPALRQAVEEGNAELALSMLPGLRMADIAALPPEACVRVAGWLEEKGHDIAANNLLRQCLVGEVSHRDQARVRLALGRLRLEQGQPAAAWHHLLAALELDPDPETERRVRAALARVPRFRS